MSNQPWTPILVIPLPTNVFGDNHRPLSHAVTGLCPSLLTTVPESADAGQSSPSSRSLRVNLCVCYAIGWMFGFSPFSMVAWSILTFMVFPTVRHAPV